MNDMTFCTLPYDLKMVDRVTEIDYNGGVYGRGIICGEKQVMQIDSYSMRITNADK